MGYRSTASCIEELEKNGHLIKINEEVDPYLEMSTIHLKVFEKKGPAILFENIKGTKFKAVSNLYGTLERSHFIFKDTIQTVKDLISLKNDPVSALKNPLKFLKLIPSLIKALPKKVSYDSCQFETTTINQLPLIQCWPMDGGPFVTLPIVYSENILKPGILKSNLGMYRIQLSGNEYKTNQEIGLHYQLHRGIGVHQTLSNQAGKPLKVSIFVGGPPAHTLAAIMPLPEDVPEVSFAGVLGNRRFRYCIQDGYVLSADADFVITGEVFPMENKPEGPFGDHLGYYSLKHDFPVMRVHQVYHKKNAIWPFTVVGRPPQEDTQFGALIHDLTGDAIPKEIPGLYEVNAVDAAGVHPLLLTIGSERYTPYLKEKKPQEILTIANHILGKGQLSLAKYVFITAKEDNASLSTHHIESYFEHILERIDLTRDIHFYTKTSIDTLDYSGTNINDGSKVVIAAVGETKRELGSFVPNLPDSTIFKKPTLLLKGILIVEGNKYTSNEAEKNNIELWAKQLETIEELTHFPLIIIADDSEFTAKNLNNFLWITFTRSNPSHDIYGVNEFIEHKHWGCKGSLIIDARKKPHHAPELIIDEKVEKNIQRFSQKGSSLFGYI
jgi:4-hydroxy-3-polyprenylbenzoate decarboxylase